MHLTYKTFQKEHLDEIGATKEKLIGEYNLDSTWTVFGDGEPLFIVGHIPFWPGTTTVWMHVGVKSVLPPRETVRICSQLIEDKTESFKRVQAFIDACSTANARFVRMLGFKYESTMVDGNPYGGDFLVYRRNK